jgi:deoxyribodipyrimidine photolyase
MPYGCWSRPGSFESPFSVIQPCSRIFNPRLQGEKFNPQGAYLRRWIPELSKVPVRQIHIDRSSRSTKLACVGALSRRYSAFTMAVAAFGS